MPYLYDSPLGYSSEILAARIFKDNRDPTSSDFRNFNLGVIWLNTASLRGWLMVDRTATSGTWIQMSSTGTGILTLTGNLGGAVSANIANNVNLIGAGGVLVTGAPVTNTLTITAASSVPLQFDEDVGTATPAANILNVFGGTGIATSGAGNTVTVSVNGSIARIYTEDVGTATPVLNNLNILGGTGISTLGAGSTVTISTTGAVATSYIEDVGTAVPVANALHINGAAGITTSGAGNVVTITAGGTIPTTFTENSGSATPAANNLNVLGASGIVTSGAGSTVTISPGSTLATLYTEDVGTAAPSSNNLNIKGAAGITTSGAGSTVTITAGPTIATTYTEDAGSATPALNVLRIIGGAGISTSGAGNTVTITNTSPANLTFNEDAGSATPAAGIIRFIGAGGVSTSGAGNTVTISNSGSVATSYPTNSGTAIPLGNVLNVLGTNAANTTGSGNTITVNAINVAKWIVDPTATVGTHTTIQAAINAASSGQTIFVRPGTYTENLSLKAGVNIVAFVSDGESGNVTIVGKATFNATGAVYFSGIRFQTNSDFILVLSGSNLTSAEFDNCLFNCTNNTGISYTVANATSTLALYDCVFILAAPGIALYSSSSTGTILIQNGKGANSGGSITSSNNSAGGANVIHSNIPFCFSTSGTGILNINNSFIDTAAENCPCATFNGTAGGLIMDSYCSSGTASAVSIGAGVSATLSNVTANSSNTNAVTGAGTLVFNNVAFINTANINTTSQVARKSYVNGVVQEVRNSTASVITCNVAIPEDDTIPQNTEGVEVITVSITPVSASSKLRIQAI